MESNQIKSYLGTGFSPRFNSMAVVVFDVDRVTLWLGFIIIFYFTHINHHFTNALYSSFNAHEVIVGLYSGENSEHIEIGKMHRKLSN
jgi:hypothetical protein